MEDPRENNARANDFRYVYANGLATSFTGTEAIIVFGIKENPIAKTQSMREEVAVIMSAATAKTLAFTLTRILEDFEHKTGLRVPVDESVRERLEKIIADSTGSVATGSPPLS